MEKQNNGAEDIQKSLQMIEGMYPSMEQTYQITAQELIKLRADLYNYLVENSITVYDEGGKPIGQGVAPNAVPIQRIYQMVMHSMFLRYYQEGSLVTIDEYQKQMQTLHANAMMAEQEENSSQLVDASGEPVSSEE
jgi:hypothetical protein